MIIETINCGEQHYIGKTYEKSQGHSMTIASRMTE